MAKKKNPDAVRLGSLGGKARAKRLSAAERKRIARIGGQARQGKNQAARRQKRSA